MIFNYLDSDGKGYISYEDFTKLCPERRSGTDPAAAMIKEYKEKGELVYNFGKKQSKSPSRAQAQRMKELSSIDGSGLGEGMSMASMNTQEKSEFMKYLDALEIEDLEMITKDRKSTKKYEEGPIIYG